MSSDIEELLKTSSPTISQMITKETPPTPSGVGAPTGNVGAAPAARRSLGPMIMFILGILVIGGLIGGAIWYLLPQTTTIETPSVPDGASGIQSVPVPPGAPQPAPIPVPVPAPQPLFSTDASRTITVPDDDRSVFLKLVTDTLQEQERPGTIKRVLIKLHKGQGEHYATIHEFFDLWHIVPPPNFLQHVEPLSMFFVYYGPDGPRIGFVAKTRDPKRTFGDIFAWERSLISDFMPFLFQESVKLPESPLFEDRTFSNTDWRFLKLSTQKDLGVGYLIFQANRLVVFTTSKGSMESIIKRFYGTQ